MRLNHESREGSDEDDSRLRRIVGEDNFEVLKGGQCMNQSIDLELFVNLQLNV